MRLNMSRFTETFNKIAYDFKYDYALDYVSNSLLYCFNNDLAQLECETEHELTVSINRILYTILKNHALDKLKTEENIIELVDRVIDALTQNFDYYTDLLMYGKYDMRKYWAPYGTLDEDYKEVKAPNKWNECPNCKLKPLIWIFDNGATARCGCEDLYIGAESYSSLYLRTGKTYYENAKSPMCEDELMYNWNHYCETGENLFAKQKAENKDIF